MPKSIFITGGSGFVGSAVISELSRRGYSVRALVNNKPIDRSDVTSIRGDFFDPHSLDNAMRDCDAAIHLVGIIREDPARGQTFERIHYQASVNVIDAAQRNGVKRFIHMSALGARKESQSEYASTKARAEEVLSNSALDYTILRPSVIHGPRGEFMRMLAGWAMGKALPFVFMPYFGAGLLGQHSALLQPIFVDDCARAFVDAIDMPSLMNRSLELVGPDRFTWPQMYNIVSPMIRGYRKPTLGIPRWYAGLLTRVVPARLLPFNKSQIVMAGENSVAEVSEMTRHFDWSPQSFETTVRAYAEQLRG